MIRCTNDSNVHNRTIYKRWSFIWRCFFPESLLNFFFHIHIETCVRLALHKKAIQTQSSSTSFTNHSENSPTRKLTRRTLNTETKLKSNICFFCDQKEYASNEKQLKGLTLHRVTTLNRDWSGSALLIWETPN